MPTFDDGENLGSVRTKINAAISQIEALPTRYDTVSDLLASEEVSRGVGAVWEAQGFRYEEVATGGHVATAAGVELNVLQGGYGYDVRAFAATGDGVTDDTTKIQAGIDAAEAVGGALFFPEGTYVVTAQLTVDSDDVTLFGVGRGSVLKTTADINIIRATGASRISVLDLSMQGNSTGSSQDGIRCINVTDSMFRGIYVKDVGHDGILLISGCIGNSVVGCHVDGSGDDGINIGGDAPASENNTVAGNVVENCTNDGIHVSDNSEGTSVSGNTCFNNGYGIGLFNAKRVAISGNVLRNNTNRGIHTPSGNCTNVSISGNSITGGLRGINIDAGRNFSIVGNVVDAPSDYGIVVSGPDDVTVVGNQVRDGCSNSAIFLSGTEDTTVVGNSVDACGGDGIFVNSDATFFCVRATIANNVINNPGDEGIDVENGSFSEHIKITGNIINNPTNRGIEYRGGPYFKISDNTVTDATDYGILVTAASLQAGKGQVCGNTVEGGCTAEGIRVNNYNLVTVRDNVVYDITSSTGINIPAGSAIVGGNIVEDTVSGSTGGILTSDSASGTTLGTVTNKIEIFDKTGVSVGFAPVYDSIA